MLLILPVVGVAVNRPAEAGKHSVAPEYGTRYPTGQARQESIEDCKGEAEYLPGTHPIETVLPVVEVAVYLPATAG